MYLAPWDAPTLESRLLVSWIRDGLSFGEDEDLVAYVPYKGNRDLRRPWGWNQPHKNINRKFGCCLIISACRSVWAVGEDSAFGAWKPHFLVRRKLFERPMNSRRPGVVWPPRRPSLAGGEYIIRPPLDLETKHMYFGGGYLHFYMMRAVAPSNQRSGAFDAPIQCRLRRWIRGGCWVMGRRSRLSCSCLLVWDDEREAETRTNEFGCGFWGGGGRRCNDTYLPRRSHLDEFRTMHTLFTHPNSPPRSQVPQNRHDWAATQPSEW